MEPIYAAMMEIERKIRDRVEGVAPDLLAWRQAADAWSILEVAGHLVDADLDYWGRRVRRIAAEDGFQIQRDFDQVILVQQRGYHALSLEEILSRLAESRRGLVGLFQSLPDPAWDHRAIYPTTTRTLREFPPLVVRHDDSHMNQIDRVKERLSQA